MEKQPDLDQEKLESNDYLVHASSRTKELGSNLATLLTQHFKQHLPAQTEKVVDHQPPEKAKHFTTFITFLKILPYFLFSFFLLARFWDFDGLSIILFENSVSLEGLLTMISVSGLIGYLTNWLAINMLFKPKYKRPVLGQGLIPSQRDRIAYRLAQAVSRDLINPEIIKNKLIETDLIGTYRRKGITLIHNVLQSPEFRNELKSTLQNYVGDLVDDPELRAQLAKDLIQKFEDSLDDKSMEKMAVRAYMMMRGEYAQEVVENAIKSLPNQIESALSKLDESLDTIPVLIEERSDKIEEWVSNTLFSILQQFDVHSLVEGNIKKFDEDRLSNLIKGTTNEQFQYIQYLGALLGMVGGLVIWQPILSTIGLAIIILTIIGLDKWLYHLQQRKIK